MRIEDHEELVWVSGDRWFQAGQPIDGSADVTTQDLGAGRANLFLERLEVVARLRVGHGAGVPLGAVSRADADADARSSSASTTRRTPCTTNRPSDEY